jgi:hypothetical protein
LDPELANYFLMLFGTDAKSFLKYNAVDSKVDQQECHDVIYSEFAEGKRVLFHDLISKQQERLEADEVFPCHSCFISY